MTDILDSNHPWGDPAFERAVKETAYFMWENDGRLEGREQEYWYRALEMHLRQRDADQALIEPVASQIERQKPRRLATR